MRWWRRRKVTWTVSDPPEERAEDHAVIAFLDKVRLHSQDPDMVAAADDAEARLRSTEENDG